MKATAVVLIVVYAVECVHSYDVPHDEYFNQLFKSYSRLVGTQAYKERSFYLHKLYDMLASQQYTSGMHKAIKTHHQREEIPSKPQENIGKNTKVNENPKDNRSTVEYYVPATQTAIRMPKPHHAYKVRSQREYKNPDKNQESGSTDKQEMPQQGKQHTTDESHKIDERNNEQELVNIKELSDISLENQDSKHYVRHNEMKDRPLDSTHIEMKHSKQSTENPQVSGEIIKSAKSKERKSATSKVRKSAKSKERNLSQAISEQTIPVSPVTVQNAQQESNVDKSHAEKCDVKEYLECNSEAPYRSIDGTCNNLKHPRWGSAGTLFQRWMRPFYQDDKSKPAELGHTGKPLASARAITTKFLEISTDQDKDIDGTHMLMLFGQFIDHDTDLTRKVKLDKTCCKNGQHKQSQPEECLPIQIPEHDHRFNGEQCMEFVRSAGEKHCTDWREQFNNITSYIDASQIYGSDEETAHRLRAYEKGKLKVNHHKDQHPDELPFDTTNKTECVHNQQNVQCYFTGDERGNVWVGLTALHTVFLREHNRISHQLFNKIVLDRPELTKRQADEIAYQETRKIIAAQLQVITYKEWLPLILPKSTFKLHQLSLDIKPEYDPALNPTIANVFATAAFRFAHTMIPRGTQPLDEHYFKVQPFVPLDEMSMQPATFQKLGEDSIIRGLISEQCQGIDKKYSHEIRDNLFRVFTNNQPLDLIALNIQRGRDHGIPPYNAWREFCGMNRAGSFDELVDHSREDRQTIQRVYEHVDDIDLYVGAVSELKIPGSRLGPTFACLLGTQFENLRYGDRYWFENADTYTHPFTAKQIETLKQTTLATILCENLNIVEISEKVFQVNNSRIPCEKTPKLNLSLW